MYEEVVELMRVGGEEESGRLRGQMHIALTHQRRSPRARADVSEHDSSCPTSGVTWTY